MDSKTINQEEKKKPVRSKIIQEIISILMESTSHGIPRIIKNIVKNDWLIATMWTIVFFTSFSYCISTLINSFTTYYSFSVTSTISKIESLPATFPAITICNINPFNEAYADVYIQNKTERAKCFNYTESIEFNNCMKSFNNTEVAFETFNDQIKRIIANQKNLTEHEYWLYGYDLQTDMTISCQYNGKDCFNVSLSFQQYWDHTYGNCYRFNKDGQLKTSSTGDGYGLQMELIAGK